MTAWSAVTSGAAESWGDGDAGATKTWSAVTSGAAESWSDSGNGSTQTWTAQGSNTTTRNTSRFVLLRPSAGSVAGGVDFGVNLRSLTAGGRGAAFLITTGDPVRLHTSGDSTV